MLGVACLLGQYGMPPRDSSPAWLRCRPMTSTDAPPLERSAGVAHSSGEGKESPVNRPRTPAATAAAASAAPPLPNAPWRGCRNLISACRCSSGSPSSGTHGNDSLAAAGCGSVLKPGTITRTSASTVAAARRTGDADDAEGSRAGMPTSPSGLLRAAAPSISSSPTPLLTLGSAGVRCNSWPLLHPNCTAEHAAMCASGASALVGCGQPAAWSTSRRGLADDTSRGLASVKSSAMMSAHNSAAEGGARTQSSWLSVSFEGFAPVLGLAVTRGLLSAPAS
eukprot:365429-Chlamydomonas_euryale.AAC.18